MNTKREQRRDIERCIEAKRERNRKEKRKNTKEERKRRRQDTERDAERHREARRETLHHRETHVGTTLYAYTQLNAERPGDKPRDIHREETAQQQDTHCDTGYAVRQPERARHCTHGAHARRQGHAALQVLQVDAYGSPTC